MNILHFSNKPMYPVLDGGCTAMVSLYQCLDKLNDTDHIYLATPKHPYVQDAYPRDLPVPLKQLNVDTRIRPLAAFWSLITHRNYNLSRFHSKNVVRKLKHLLEKKQYDVVVLESLFLTSYLSAFRAAGVKTVIVRAHNVEYTLWEQWADQASGWKSFYLRRLAKTLKREEIKRLNQVDAIWAITDADERLFKQLVPGVPVNQVRVAVEISGLNADYSKAEVFHVGSLNWQPNKDAVTRLERIWNEFERPVTSKLHIAGSFSEEYKSISNASDTIVYHGFVADLKGFMGSHGVLCSPILSGSGVRIKLLEAMALGVPCITTSIGATGISNPETLMMIAQSDQEIACAIQKLLSDESLRTELGSRGKEYVSKYHSFTAVTSQLRTLLGL